MEGSKSVNEVWKEKLGLSRRAAPELFESTNVVGDAPHAAAIRVALDDLGLSAIFCVQGVPTVAILSVETHDRAAIVDLHGALWNQGLVSLLLVISGDTLRAYSLARKPHLEADESFDQRCLIEALTLTSDALRFSNLIQGAESGRLWKEYADFFNPRERIDQVLLENLKVSHKLLSNEQLSSDAAQALLIQAMFIAYLEDREIITPDYFRAVTRNECDSFSALLFKRNVRLLKALFSTLKEDFNGDLFVAPCSFDRKGSAPEIRAEHLDIIARFRTGHEEMRKGQHRFWGYDFRYIPIELVSAVYDRFLGEKEEQRREQGAYYTPMFLADTVVSQMWDLLPVSTKDNGRCLDPACGSGVFLVRTFQRLCEHWRATHKSRTIRWNSLLGILQRVHGWDLNGSAVRVAVFSLYVALLEEVSPPDIRRLISNGKILPELWSKTLVCRDFFEAPDSELYHLIVGNPPWTSRRGADRSSVQWANKNSLPMPGGEDAWAFAWKAIHHLTADGKVGFLVPAMGFFHNHADNAVEARNAFIAKNKIDRIINFADLRFQLFERAHRPAALVIYGRRTLDGNDYRFDYWTPKADLNLQIRRFITLSTADKSSLSAAAALDNPMLFKQRLWMREPDGKLFGYLSRLPKLGDLVSDFGGFKRRKQDFSGKWVVGQGFKPFNGQDDYGISKYVHDLPYLPIQAFQRIAQPIDGLSPWHSSRVHRKGFEAGFRGPRILVPRGVETAQTRLRAAYVEEPLTFQDIIQAIAIPEAERTRGKLLTALLNSRVAVWYAFHGTASFGSDRPEVKQAELLRLPFPAPADLPDPDRAKRAETALVSIVDHALKGTNAPFALANSDQSVLSTIDRLAYDYFCLSDDEIVLIEDAVEKVIPAIQPHEGAYPDLWRAPTEHERRAYAQVLIETLGQWLRRGTPGASLEALSPDLAVLHLSLDKGSRPYSESKYAPLGDVLSYLSEHIHRPLHGNFQLVPDLRIFVGRSLYLIKPMQLRFWLRATALADADALAMELQDALLMERQRSQF